MRKKEQTRQQILIRRGGRGGRGDQANQQRRQERNTRRGGDERQQRQGLNEHVHNNAAFDVDNHGSNAVDDEGAVVYTNDAYGNVPQSTLTRNQANGAAVGSGAGAGASSGAVYATYAGLRNIDGDYDIPDPLNGGETSVPYADLGSAKQTYA
eukprot:gene911-13526_t